MSEYTEEKVRVYYPKKKKDEGVLTKIAKVPMKLVGVGKKKEQPPSRLTA